MTRDLPVLALDTSTSMCSLAIGDDHKIRHAWSAWAPRGHSEMLHPALAAAFSALGWSPAAAGSAPLLSAIAVTTGPGSFTGLRIGIAAAKGLAHAWDLPLVGLPTLAVMAWGVLSEGRLAIAAIPSRREDCYAGLYRGTGAALPEIIGDVIVAPPGEALACLLERAAQAPPDLEAGAGKRREVVLCGSPWRSESATSGYTIAAAPALDAGATAITAAGGLTVSIAGAEHDWPRAADLAAAAAVARRAGGGQPPELVTPIYIRRPGLGGVVDSGHHSEGGIAGHA